MPLEFLKYFEVLISFRKKKAVCLLESEKANTAINVRAKRAG